MAQPALGWCDRPMRKPPTTERFVPQRLFLDTKRLNDGSRCIPQTTPCRCASAVAARHIPS